MSQHQVLHVKQVGPVSVVQPVTPEIVGRSFINVFSDELLEFVESEKPQKLVLTLTAVSNYSSEAIGGLIRVVRRLESQGGKMKICMKADLRELFKVTRLDGTLFEIHTTEDDAIEAFFRN
jgi:anti-anti-sigma factor